MRPKLIPESLYSQQFSKGFRERFWSRVHKTDSCWLWTGHVMTNGYGGFCNWNNNKIGAHRISWMIHNGEIPNGLFVCHTCDRKICVAPHHLWLGTSDENMKDAAQKGIMSKGSDRWNSKLTEDAIPDIIKKLNAGMTQQQIALFYKVDTSLISRIKNGYIWRHVSRA